MNCNKAFDFKTIEEGYDKNGDYVNEHEVHKCRIKPGIHEDDCQLTCGHYSSKYSKKWNKTKEE